MLYIITFIFFLLWSILVIKKGNLTWHAVISIYVIGVFFTDYGDVPFDFWVNFYDLPVHLLTNIDIGKYLGIIFSDGMIFPLVAIVFCYYSVQYRRPWLLSIIFALFLGLLEVFYVKFGFMIYHHWTSLTTPIISFIILRILYHFADRLVNYLPPISYKFRLLCAVYVITEWPGALFAGLLRLYQYKVNIFDNAESNDRFMGMAFATAAGGIAAIFINRIQERYKVYFFAALGILSAFFALWMHAKGVLIYNHWNNFITITRYIVPYVFVYLYDRWESTYTRKFDYSI